MEYENSPLKLKSDRRGLPEDHVPIFGAVLDVRHERPFVRLLLDECGGMMAEDAIRLFVN
jgi:hypothetical protein